MKRGGTIGSEILGRSKRSDGDGPQQGFCIVVGSAPPFRGPLRSVGIRWTPLHEPERDGPIGVGLGDEPGAACCVKSKGEAVKEEGWTKWRVFAP